MRHIREKHPETFKEVEAEENARKSMRGNYGKRTTSSPSVEKAQRPPSEKPPKQPRIEKYEPIAEVMKTYSKAKSLYEK